VADQGEQRWADLVLPDDDKHTVWIVYASAAHPRQTD